jgi:hypothetical protein
MVLCCNIIYFYLDVPKYGGLAKLYFEELSMSKVI